MSGENTTDSGTGKGIDISALSLIKQDEPVTEPEQVEQIHCVDEKTGKKIWKFVYPCRYRELSYPLGPRAAVAINDGKAYALGAMGHLHCLDAASEELLWKKDMLEEYDASNPVWGITSSPLVDDKHVYIQINSPLAAPKKDV